MKKVSLLLILAFAALTTAFAQEAGTSVNAGRKTTFVKNGFWDNWFIGAGASANMYFGDNDADAATHSRVNFMPTIQVGKWNSPLWGIRGKLDGGRLHTFSSVNSDADVMHRMNMVNGHVDLMWNVTNTFLKYNSKRVYNFIPYAGIGFAFGWRHSANFQNPEGVTLMTGSKNGKSATINFGIINSFRLSNRLNLDIELSGALLQDRFDKKIGGKYSADGMAGVSASVVYKLGKTEFTEAILLDQDLIDGLNGEINRLRAENAELAKRPVNCPEQEVKVITKEVPVGVAGPNNFVVFRINSANIDRAQEINVYNAAKFLQDNPNAKVKVVGYADKKTGTPAYNEKLSEKRAKNVANALINKYSIDSNRVQVEWKGDSVQPYSNNNAWNRVAIFIME
ncbi:OmpA family protein [Dysgonomonas massiliensis]|uniref:OmpA family protein n=1 Tax=Dysgonomonas massiliensis TaxID=2040292 RepID=UPI000C77D247|nr:OmpA family protein [Dysgonomonas massiliensis]